MPTSTPNLETTSKTIMFSVLFAMSPILQMMPNMTPKWCPNGRPNRSNIDQTSIWKPIQNLNASWHRIYRYWSVWGPKMDFKIESKSMKNRSWAPMATPRPPKTHQRPSQDPPKTENRPQIDPKSAQNPPNIDATPQPLPFSHELPPGLEVRGRRHGRSLKII